jgi:magnesium chelatase subunit D
VAGHRADLVIEQAARAHAALDGRPDVTVDDVRKVAGFVFLHRRREPAPPPPPEKNHDHDHSHEPEQNQDSDHQDNNDKQDQQDHQDQGEDREETEERPEPSSETGGEGEENEAGGEPENRPGMPDTAGDRVFDVGETFKVRSISPPKDRIFRRGSGRRTRSRVSRKQGRYVKSTANRGNGDIAFDATLRAAAPHQVNRAGDNGLCVQLTEPDIREKIREKRIGSFLLFVVDASGSMGARGRMAASKGAVMSLLLDAYQKRDKVAMVTFRKEDAVINLPPTSSIDLAARLFNDMPVGGKTPLCAGLVKGYELVRSHLLKDPLSRPVMILITDGRGNVPLGGSPMKTEKPAAEALALAEAMAREERITFIVVDSESPGPISFGLARKLSGTLNAAYFKIDDLKAETLMRIVKGDPI